MAVDRISQDDLELLMKAADLGLLSHEFTNKHVAITGTLSMKRADVVRLINAAGGVWDERVGWGTRVLIVGDTGRHGVTRKIRDAQMRGVRVITEGDFVRLLQP